MDQLNGLPEQYSYENVLCPIGYFQPNVCRFSAIKWQTQFNWVVNYF
jgi:hypothetical protein